jgi:hypothetical protein
MSLPERLRTLAETLDGCEWNHPLCSADDCGEAAKDIERLKSVLSKLMQAATVVYERTITPEPCTCAQCAALADLLAVMQQVKVER